MMIENRPAHYIKIHERLIDEYGQPTWRQHLPPIDELVSTILSQATSDTNRDKGFFALKERYATWKEVMEAPEKEIRETIYSAGLANQKAPRIQNCLQYVADDPRGWGDDGDLSLDFLADLALDDALIWLTKMKGVGPKTAAIIMLFAFNEPAFPVDTHVHRLTKRLGLIGPKVSANKAHDLLADIGEPETYYPFHLNIIRHGREICAARNPKCDQCFLTDLCLYYQENQ
ncbi:MAG TPA: endonuclease III [Anaerolineae bacterium]|nr:endonuclease III [Anaerolineae bacterium]